jgi:FPC/CPF motif-containing protein YcgG
MSRTSSGGFGGTAFNFHNQFEQLRASGKYDRMQRVIRRRDVALQGDANPVLSRFGEASEARQY